MESRVLSVWRADFCTFTMFTFNFDTFFANPQHHLLSDSFTPAYCHHQSNLSPAFRDQPQTQDLTNA